MEPFRIHKSKNSDRESSDQSIFNITMVPVQLLKGKEDDKSIVWQNPALSSTRYCRPIKFIFAKETADLIKKEVGAMNEAIGALKCSTVVIKDQELSVKSNFIFCMIDGKICNVISSCVSTQSCYLCGAKPSQMNDPANNTCRIVKKEFLSHGLSPLHAWIRRFECLLHKAYRLEVGTWQIRGEENKKKIVKRKKMIQEKFKRIESLC